MTVEPAPKAGSRRGFGRRTMWLLLLIGVAVAFWIASDRVYWDRYLHAHTLDSFVEHAYPTIDRLYPQEAVEGVDPPRAIPVMEESERTIRADSLEAAEHYARSTKSTSLLIFHRGKLQYEAYWEGSNAETPVYSFSMHKTIVGMMVGFAIADAKIGSVEDSVAKYLPEWSDPEHSRIRVKHLLQMSSGIESMQYGDNPFSKHQRRQIGTDLERTTLSFDVQEPPGQRFDYNGINPTLLAMILERATGRRYAEYLSEKLWKPLGNRTAHVWLDHEGGLVFAATSLFATPRDWLRVGIMMLDGGRVAGHEVLPADWFQQMITPSPTNPVYGNMTWLGFNTSGAVSSLSGGLGRYNTIDEEKTRALANRNMICFDGLGGQRVYVFPDAELVIVRTGVLDGGFEDPILPNLVLEGITPANPTPQPSDASSI
jgi:CubicO group peptidase (beta-lactamase class C family)